MSVAIRVEHLSKEYRLGVINHGMLYKVIQSWLARKLGRPDPHAPIGADHYADQKDRFWALKDLTFDIEQGDRVGIIGRNGAGKSTLLKILSRITAPTEGIVKIKGRVASLLEVGTGFHGELTGRENIYLNGAILGMKKREIDRKIDEIIDFSEIEQHIDTPVKRYSSGMYVRLAFAVAAHLDSEILIADEVLAVGDTTFQKKALGKMHDISSNQGKTILFVSHNMGAVRQLCGYGVLLEKGRIVLHDNIDNVINHYLNNPANNNSVIIFNNDEKALFQFISIELMDCTGTQKNTFEIDDEIVVGVKYKLVCDMSGVNVALTLKNEGFVIFNSWDTDVMPERLHKRERGSYYALFRIPRNINIGVYSITLTAGIPNVGVMVEKENCISFRIVNNSINANSQSFSRGGFIKTDILWDIRKES